MARSWRRQTARRVRAVDARRQAEPRRKRESWRSERGEEMGVRSEAGTAGGAGGCSGVVLGGGGGLSWGVELLAGGAGERVIMRMMGSFCRASMGGGCAVWAGDLEGEDGGCGRMRTPEAMSGGGEAFLSIVKRGVGNRWTS